MHYCHEVIALPEWCRNGLLKIFPLNLTSLEYTFSLVKFFAVIMKSQPVNIITGQTSIIRTRYVPTLQ